MFKDLFETESILKLIFVSHLYEMGSRDIWNELHSLRTWTTLLRYEKQILSGINSIPPTELSWLDLVNLYGYLIGEDVFATKEVGLSTELSKLPGNHPHRFILATLKGFDRTIEEGGSLTSYYATYAIEGVCTFSYLTLRDNKTRGKLRHQLLQELNCRIASAPQNVVLREKEAIEQIHLLEGTIDATSTTLSNSNISIVLRHVKGIVSNLLPSINKWIYLTYAETNKPHGYAITRMSTRFSHATFISPDFQVNAKGEVSVVSFPTFEPAKRIIEPREKTLGFFRTSMLPKIESENYKRLAKKYLLKFNGRA
jgi:hypothetical protein